jgi:hypothetical protein
MSRKIKFLQWDLWKLWNYAILGNHLFIFVDVDNTVGCECIKLVLIVKYLEDSPHKALGVGHVQEL